MCFLLVTFRIKHYNVHSLASTPKVTDMIPFEVIWFRHFVHPKPVDVRKDPCMNQFSDFWGLVSVREWCHQRCGWYLQLSPCSTWMDLTFLWKYMDSLLLFSQQVDTVFCLNFHKRLLVISLYMLAFKFELRWQKTNNDTSFKMSYSQ